jgi:hypothetical protein
MLDIAAASADSEGGMSGSNTWCDRRHRMPDKAQFAHHHHWLRRRGFPTLDTLLPSSRYATYPKGLPRIV